MLIYSLALKRARSLPLSAQFETQLKFYTLLEREREREREGRMMFSVRESVHTAPVEH